MNRWHLAQIATWAGGRLEGEDGLVKGVSIDSRTASADKLFVALKGDRFDGHDFIGPDLHAAAVMVFHEVSSHHPRIVVEDTLHGMSQFAAAWRASLSAQVIALTGSNGKTTVKEMLASILSRVGPTLATRGNLNNHIGVPLTLLEIEPEHRFAVVEMGANHAGEIAALTEMTQPTVALVNNAGPAHLEGFGSLAGVARAKGEIYGGLSTSGVAVINADDPFADDWLALNRRHQVLRFGIKMPAEVHGDYQAGLLGISTPQGDFEVRLPFPGYHNAMNALAATAAALAVGANPTAIRAGLESLQAVPGRLRRIEGSGGILILDDTYNANPGSLAAGLNVLAEQPGTHWLVLGDMAELGDAGPALHREAGERARLGGVGRLFTLGHLSSNAAAAFGSEAHHYSDLNDLTAAIQQAAEKASRPLAILVKGSRSMGLERLVTRLQAKDGTASCGRHHAV